MQLIFNIEDSIQLLPQFLAHYAALGFDRFHIGVARGQDNPLYEPIRSCCAPFNYTIRAGVTAHFSGPADARAADGLRAKYVAPGDWYGVADLDEFHDYSPYGSVSELLAFAQAQHVDAVAGELWDRIATDGSIPAQITDAPVSGQFPLGCQLTRKIAKGSVQKVMLARGTVPIGPGHHRHHAKALPMRGLVHHYKWHGNLLERLQRRAVLYRKLGLPWWKESQRVLDYLARHGGRIPVEDKRLECRTVEPAERPILRSQ